MMFKAWHFPVVIMLRRVMISRPARIFIALKKNSYTAQLISKTVCTSLNMDLNFVNWFSVGSCFELFSFFFFFPFFVCKMYLALTNLLTHMFGCVFACQVWFYSKIGFLSN